MSSLNARRPDVKRVRVADPSGDAAQRARNPDGGAHPPRPGCVRNRHPRLKTNTSNNHPTCPNRRGALQIRVATTGRAPSWTSSVQYTVQRDNPCRLISTSHC